MTGLIAILGGCGFGGMPKMPKMPKRAFRSLYFDRFRGNGALVRVNSHPPFSSD